MASKKTRVRLSRNIYNFSGGLMVDVENDKISSDIINSNSVGRIIYSINTYTTSSTTSVTAPNPTLPIGSSSYQAKAAGHFNVMKGEKYLKVMCQVNAVNPTYIRIGYKPADGSTITYGTAEFVAPNGSSYSTVIASVDISGLSTSQIYEWYLEGSGYNSSIKRPIIFTTTK